MATLRVRPLRPGRMILYAVLCVISLFYIYPLIWLVMNSLKHTQEIYSSPWLWPQEWIWSNYVKAWTVGKTRIYLFNSAWITAVTLAGTLILGSMAAFGITMLRWKLSKATMVYFLLGMMVPIHATLIPLFIYFSKIGLVNSQLGLVLIYTAFGMPATVLILSGFLSAVPRELLEAAVMDGCTMYGVYGRVVLPVMKSALMTCAIFGFVGTWNELLVALVFISDPAKMTLPIGLRNFSDQYTTDYAAMFAAILLATLPTIVLTALFNKRIMDGMTAGAVKG